MEGRNTYKLIATREGGWWSIEVPEIPGVFSQARRLDQAEHMARDAIAWMLEVPEDSFDVVVEAQLPRGIQEILADTIAARVVAEGAQKLARSASDAAARALREQGLPARDIGRLLGISYQRAAKIGKEA